MADISLIQDESFDDPDDGGEPSDSEGRDYDSANFQQDEESLTPCAKLEKYALSENIFNRQMVPSILLEIFRDASVDSLTTDLPALMDIIAGIADDTETAVRTDLVQRIPHLAAACVEYSSRVPALGSVVEEHLLPLVVKYLGDADGQVRKSTHSALLALMEQGLVPRHAIESQVCPKVLHYTHADSLMDYHTGAVTLMGKMVPLLGRETTERLFLQRFSELCSSPMFYIRKICASSFGEFCAVVGRNAYEHVLLPCFIELCADEIWGVRKACAEVVMTVSCACSPESRRVALAPAFARLLQDQSRWVRMSAFQTLGPFISTFADPSIIGLAYNQIGELVLINPAGTEFRINSPAFTDANLKAAADFKQRFYQAQERIVNKNSPLSHFFSLEDKTDNKISWLELELGEYADSRNNFNETPDKSNCIQPVDTTKQENTECDFSSLNTVEIVIDHSSGDSLHKELLAQNVDLKCSGDCEDNIKEEILCNDINEKIQCNDKNEEILCNNIEADKNDVREEKTYVKEEKGGIKKELQNDDIEKPDLLAKIIKEMSLEEPNEKNNIANGPIDNTDENLDKYNVYQYWYISPDLPLDPSIVNPSASGNKHSGMGDSNFINRLDDIQFNNSFNPALDDTLPIDKTRCLNNSTDKTIPSIVQPVITQEIVPQLLIDHFVSMTDPGLAANTDNDMAYHCAFSLPAVALTLGRNNWFLLKKTCYLLASDMQYKIRRTVASSLHELALILGQDMAADHLLPIFDGFIKDLDEVRIGVLKHLAHFLKLIGPEKRNMYLPRLSKFLQTDNEWNWRFREELANQLLLAVPLFTPVDASKHIAMLAQELLCDKVYAVRQVALSLVTELVRHVSGDPNLTSCLLLKLAEEFAHSKRWVRRQAFALLCSRLISTSALPPDQFATIIMPHLLDLSWDPVPNVRLAVSRTLSRDIIQHEYFADVNSEQHEPVNMVLRRLQADKDRDVRQYAAPPVH